MRLETNMFGMANNRQLRQQTGLLILVVSLMSWSNASSGREFYLVFMQHYVFAEPGLSELTVSFSNPNPAVVRVGVDFVGLVHPEIRESLAAWQSLTITLPHDVLLDSDAVKYTKYLYITSGDDIFVQSNVDYEDKTMRSAYGFMVLPTSSLTSEYIAVTHCVVAKCLIVVTSVENGNVILVHVRTTATGQAEYAGTQYEDEKTISEVLNKGESMQVVCNQCDLTGTWVQASKRVAVFAGGEFTRSVNSRNNFDAVAEQMVPKESLGKSYVLGANYNAPYLREVVKVVLLMPGDAFTFNGTTYTASTSREVFIFEERDMADIAEINGNQPMLVAEVIAGLTSGDYPDVSLILPLPVERWNRSFAAFIPYMNASMPRDQAFVCLVMPPDTDPAWIESVVGNAPEASSLTTTDDSYKMVWLEYRTEGLRGLWCTHPKCDPFWGFVIHNRDKRSSVYGLVPARFDLSAQTTAEPESTSYTKSTLVDSTVTLSPGGTPSYTDVITNIDNSTKSDVIPTDDVMSQSAITTEPAAQASRGPQNLTSVNTSGLTISQTLLSTDTATTKESASQNVTAENYVTTESLMTTETETSSKAIPVTQSDVTTQNYFVTGQTSTQNSVVSTSATPKMTSQSPVKTPFGKCRCVKNVDISKQEKAAICKQADASITSNLLQDRKKMSLYLRTKVSAYDDRTSPVVLGATVGIVTCAMVVVFVIGLDVTRCVTGSAETRRRYWNRAARRKRKTSRKNV